MRTVRRLLYRDIVWSVVFVAVAFLSLFFFIDVVDDLDKVGRSGFTLARAALNGLLEVPGHFYELFPIAVLIGTIYAMARLAQSSEFIILRTAGLGPGRALRLLAAPGLAFAALTFVVGDHLVPLAERLLLQTKAPGRAPVAASGGGAWLKDRRDVGTPQERSMAVRVQALQADGRLQGVEVFEFDRDGRLRRRLQAPEAQLEAGLWRLRSARVAQWPTPAEAAAGQAVNTSEQAELVWPNQLDPGVVAAALGPAKTMSTLDLWRYTRHLQGQAQEVQRHEIQFWKKAFYPLACVVMVALALPFAYLHARAGGVSYKVFGGIMLGISFVVLNNATSHLGVLKGWTPWLAAAAPSLLYLLLSMAAFAWLVRYR